MTRILTVAVDRLEGSVAVIVMDDGRQLDIPRRRLPKEGRRAGAVMQVEVNEKQEPIWSTARVDRGQEQRRLDEARQRLDRLKASDSGGDVSL
jgi:hypothetical protein